jgi:hypothetical protein
MEQSDCDYVLTILRPLADELRPLGPSAREPTILIDHLERKSKFNRNFLEQHQVQIYYLFSECLIGSYDMNATCTPSLPYAVFSPASPPLPRPSAPSAPSQSKLKSQSTEYQSSERTSESTILKPKVVDEGFIRTNLTTCVGARFSYSWKNENNRIGWAFLRENELLSQAENNKIKLTFWLESRPKKSYRLEFRIQKKASFDVSLGTNWNREAEDGDENTIGVMIKRIPSGKLTVLFVTHFFFFCLPTFIQNCECQSRCRRQISVLRIMICLHLNISPP